MKAPTDLTDETRPAFYEWYASHGTAQPTPAMCMEWGIAYRDKQLAETAGQFDQKAFEAWEQNAFDAGKNLSYEGSAIAQHERTAREYEAKLQFYAERLIAREKECDEALAKVARYEVALKKIADPPPPWDAIEVVGVARKALAEPGS